MLGLIDVICVCIKISVEYRFGRDLISSAFLEQYAMLCVMYVLERCEGCM